MTILKRRLVVCEACVVFVGITITFLSLISAHINGKSTSKRTSDGSSAYTMRPHSTIVSGYGSHRYPSTYRSTTNLSQMNSVSHEFDIPLYLKSQSTRTLDETSSSVYLYLPAKNITAEISAANETRESFLLHENGQPLPTSQRLNVSRVNDDMFTQHDGKNDTWIPIEGIYGVYTLPSGFLIVWIANSKPIYKAPYLNRPSDHLTTTNSWWQIRRISELHLTHVAFSRNDTLNQTSAISRGQHTEEKRQLNLLRKALKDHDWYYVKSDRMIVPDMTRNLQSCILLLSSLQSNCSVVHAKSWNTWSDSENVTSTMPDSHFFWNEALLKPLFTVETNTSNDTAFLCCTLLEHVIPVTSAFCGVQTNISLVDSSLRYDQILISRRSRFRAGTRFTRRGADDTGAVANFAETEQIVIVWKNKTSANRYGMDDRELCGVMSYVQTRGSIPLRWSSPADVKTYRPRVRIGTDPMAQARAFCNHLFEYSSRYTLSPAYLGSQQPHPSILMVNLIDKKSDQGRLGRAMDAVLKALLDVHEAEVDPMFPWLNKSFVEHLWFDFHAEVKSGRWHKLVGLLEQVKPSLDEQSYFCAVPDLISRPNNDSVTGLHVVKLQKGSIRTNCMDCLDRTNVVQSMFGRYMLFKQLAEFKAFSLPFPYKSAFRRAPSTLPWENGEIAHRFLWADNADAISRLYAGTVALKGDFTRTGKRTKRGALDDGLNSVQRYYLNNFLDAFRQEGIDLLVGNELFSSVNEQSDDSITVQNNHLRGMSVHEAARHTLPNDFNRVAFKPQDDSDHVRIKVTSNQRCQMGASIGKKMGMSPRHHLDLRWLPGDLQSQVRNLIAFSNNLSIDHKESLKDIDSRATSDIPWWVVPDYTEPDRS